MLKIGITGGIGSGKTLACKVFEQLGIPVYNADMEAKKLMQINKELIRKIKLVFGKNIYDKKNNLDRQKLAKIVFSNKNKLQQLNAIVHPAVEKDFIKWTSKHKESAYLIKEAALLFESGTYEQLDKIITIVASENLKIERIMKRDAVDKKSVLDRMKNQMSDKEKIKRADFTVLNDEKKMLLPQILKLHSKFVILCKKY